MIYKPDFRGAYMTANNILVSSNLDSFPVRAKKIIRDYSCIPCYSYKKAREYNLKMEDFGSKSAVLIEKDGKRIIFYNEKELKERQRFSMLHEYGHFKLNHNLDVKDKEEYNAYEVEANYFAAQLLMPEQLIRQLQLRGIIVTKEMIIELFGVSNEAAGKRLNTLCKQSIRSDEEREFDDIIVNKFREWLNKQISSKIGMDMFLDNYEENIEREIWVC